MVIQKCISSILLFILIITIVRSNPNNAINKQQQQQVGEAFKLAGNAINPLLERYETLGVFDHVKLAILGASPLDQVTHELVVVFKVGSVLDLLQRRETSRLNEALGVQLVGHHLFRLIELERLAKVRERHGYHLVCVLEVQLHHLVELKFFCRLKPAERGVSDNIGDRVTDTINLLEVVLKSPNL